MLSFETTGPQCRCVWPGGGRRAFDRFGHIALTAAEPLREHVWSNTAAPDNRAPVVFVCDGGGLPDVLGAPVRRGYKDRAASHQNCYHCLQVQRGIIQGLRCSLHRELQHWAKAERHRCLLRWPQTGETHVFSLTTHLQICVSTRPYDISRKPNALCNLIICKWDMFCLTWKQS